MNEKVLHQSIFQVIFNICDNFLFSTIFLNCKFVRDNQALVLSLAHKFYPFILQ